MFWEFAMIGWLPIYAVLVGLACTEHKDGGDSGGHREYEEAWDYL